MLSHKLIACVEFTFTNGETRKHALVVTPTDYVIAHGYRGQSECWDNGFYMPRFETDVATALKNFAADVEDTGTSAFTTRTDFVA